MSFLNFATFYSEEYTHLILYLYLDAWCTTANKHDKAICDDIFNNNTSSLDIWLNDEFVFKVSLRFSFLQYFDYQMSI